jgi:hypothetical protein
MAVYVDQLAPWGWVLRGNKVLSCHMFTDSADLEELHAVALRIGMKREWFQSHRIAPHYDLTPSRRLTAVTLGVIEVSRRQASEIWRARRELTQTTPHLQHAANSSEMAFAREQLSRSRGRVNEHLQQASV